MKKLIIISGHGNYATGLQSTIELLAGHNGDMFFIDFTVDDTDVTLKEKIINVVNSNSDAGVLFVCDILGGTPFKIAAEIANDNENMEVVVGCNVGSIIESIFQRDDLSIMELAEAIVNTSKSSTMRFEKVRLDSIKSADLNSIEIEEGI